MPARPILIIDDDNRNTFALSAVLRSRGYTILIASGGAEGLQAISANPEISIVLLDMMMPGMDGYEFLEILRSDHPTLPVISVTAQAMHGDREKCLQAGADAYLPKPVNVDELLLLLNNYIK